ncbi:MAG: type VI secretion system contractile sheath large subunit, partial [Chromatiales bacterium]|nr:type VI secretion system contractile sheath large subunit [Chromatiales bacterium]
EPFGVLLGNYQVTHLSRISGQDDIQILSGMSAIAAASFAPFIVNAHPSLLELDSFAELHGSVNLTTTFQQKSYIKWKAFRKTEDARFVGITLPRLLIREPYAKTATRVDKFVYSDRTKSGDKGDYLWIGSSFAFGSVLARCFSSTGWLAEITGVRSYSGGTVDDLPTPISEVDRQGKMPAEVLITDDLERELSDHGFIPLSYTTNSDIGVFYSASSVQSPQSYAEKIAQINSKYSSMLQYVFCTSRFSHYLKVIVRDKVGAFASAEDCRHYLQNWILNYVMSTDEASEKLLSQYPLRDAKISVYEQTGSAGAYFCIAHIKPHFQLEAIETSIHFVAEVVPARVTG